MAQVRAHRRKDGSMVRAHTRNAPRSGHLTDANPGAARDAARADALTALRSVDSAGMLNSALAACSIQGLRRVRDAADAAASEAWDRGEPRDKFVAAWLRIDREVAVREVAHLSGT